ncbi:MAG: capsular polysaccharide biosynthesis protein [Pseudomonadota bacterium]
MLRLAGWEPQFGWPNRSTKIGVWGRRPVSWRGRKLAKLTGAQIVTFEDGFLRSILPGSRGDPPLSLVIDECGIYFDANTPSGLERLILEAPEDPVRRDRARRGIEALQKAGLSKYTPIARNSAGILAPGYVLVIDQTRGDASIAGAGADATSFQTMLAAARHENPGARLLVRAHPETVSGMKAGHFRHDGMKRNEIYCDRVQNPWDLIEGASHVYTVSSQLGFEALMAGKPVTCFGAPFYAGWGLTDDRVNVPRRGVARTLEQVFAAAYFDYPTYFDPYYDRITDFEGTVGTLQTLSNASRKHLGEDRVVFCGFRSWKRRHCLDFTGSHRSPARAVRSCEKAVDLAAGTNAELWLWASRSDPEDLARARHQSVAAWNVEDGFLRSVGLGASLTAPCSLVFDDLGIYYDPNRPSRLEKLIDHASGLQSDSQEILRAGSLIAQINKSGVSKYNLGREFRLPSSAGRQVILVPGQVEDDASIRFGCGPIATNLALLQVARRENPDAFIVYKPHPDVEANLRPGRVSDADLAALCDCVAGNADPVDLITQADHVWTMTSLMGFEALLRGTPVTCLGIPFYAGWGLTADQRPCARRKGRPSLRALAWAALIAYPRYVDPVTRLPCEPELVVERLASRHSRAPASSERLLSKVQGWFAARSAMFWR